jgi:hypothetical protein
MHHRVTQCKETGRSFWGESIHSETRVERGQISEVVYAKALR